MDTANSCVLISDNLKIDYETHPGNLTVIYSTRNDAMTLLCRNP